MTRRRVRVIARDAVLILVAAILLAVTVDAAVSLRPRSVSFPTGDRYDPYLDDFVVFYAAGSLARERGSIYDLDTIRTREAEIAGLNPEDAQTLPYFNPPYFTFPLAALSALPLPLAAVAWTVGSMATVGIALWVVWQRRAPFTSQPLAVVLVALPILSSMPFYQLLVHGQTTGIVMMAWALLWAGLLRGNSTPLTASGLVLLSLKPQLLLIPVILSLLMGRWQAVAWASAVIAGASTVAIGWLGTNAVTGYLQLGLDASRWDEENGISIYGMFGWNSFVRGLVGSDYGHREMFIAGLLGLATVGVSALTAMKLIDRGRADMGFLAALTGSILSSVHFYAHDLLVLSLGLVVLYQSAKPAQTRQWAIGASIVLWLACYVHLDVLGRTQINGVSLLLAAALSYCVVAAFTSERPAPVMREALGG